MDIRDKVSKESEGNCEGPDDKTLVTPVVQIHNLGSDQKIYLPIVVQLLLLLAKNLFEQPLESGGILDSWRWSRGKEGGEGEGADDEDGGEGGKQLQARLKAVVLQNVLVDKAEANGEDGAASSDDPVDDPHPLLEVVAEDGEGGRVHQAGSRPKHDAIREVQNLHLFRFLSIFANSSQRKRGTPVYIPQEQKDPSQWLRDRSRAPLSLSVRSCH